MTQALLAKDNLLLSVAAAHRLAQAGAPLIDLRAPVERARDGAPPDARPFSAEALGGAIARGEIVAGPDGALILICQSGALAARTAQELAAAGHDGARAIDGGYVAWRAAELPVVIQSQAEQAADAGERPGAIGPFRIEPTSGHTGAEILGVDLRQPLASETVAKIRQALLDWKVVFFRDQFLTPAQLVRAGAYFGEVMKARSPMQVYSVAGQPEILVVGKAEYPGRGVDSPWHADLSFLPAPPMGSLLQAIDVPPYGGDTSFTNLAAAYQDLSEPIRTLIDGLWAVHYDRFRADGQKTVHPVVRVHPETGERLIWVNPNYTDHIVGLTARESDTLLELLYEHMTRQAYTTRFRWRAGSIAFWDNRGSAHVAPTDLAYEKVERILHRITLVGDVPKAVDGQPSYPFEAAR